MHDTWFSLVSELVKGYLGSKGVSDPQQTLSSNAHAVWIADGLTVTLNAISDKDVLANFVRGSMVKTVQIKHDSLDIELPVKDLNSAQEKFDTFLDEQLNEGLLQTFSQKQQPEDQPREQRQPLPQPERSSLLISSSGHSARQRPPDMPDFEDEYELKSRVSRHTAPFANIGDADLNPAGVPANPVMRPYLDPLRGGLDGGMYPSPDHPIFGSRTGNTSRTGVPPGARYDEPYGEGNLEDMGMGLPGNLRRGSDSQGPGFGFGNMGGMGGMGGSPFGGF